MLTASLVYSLGVWAISMFAPQLLIAVFTNDAELTSFTIGAMRVYMAATVIFGAQIACQQTFIALGNAKASAFLAMLRKVILLIPLVFTLPQFMEDKVLAVFLAEPIADFIAVSVTVTMFVASFKKQLAQGDREPTGQPV